MDVERDWNIEQMSGRVMAVPGWLLMDGLVDVMGIFPRVFFTPKSLPIIIPLIGF